MPFKLTKGKSGNSILTFNIPSNNNNNKRSIVPPIPKRKRPDKSISPVIKMPKIKFASLATVVESYKVMKQATAAASKNNKRSPPIPSRVEQEVPTNNISRTPSPSPLAPITITTSSTTAEISTKPPRCVKKRKVSSTNTSVESKKRKTQHNSIEVVQRSDKHVKKIKTDDKENNRSHSSSPSRVEQVVPTANNLRKTSLSPPATTVTYSNNNQAIKTTTIQPEHRRRLIRKRDIKNTFSTSINTSC